MKNIYLALSLVFGHILSFHCQANKPDIQQAKSYRGNIKVIDYWVSEKLDGVRGYWNGHKLITRQGNPIHSPNYFTHNWPQVPLDGELWSKREDFQDIVSCVRKKTPTQCWKNITFMVFDLPASEKTFTNRLSDLTVLIKKHHNNHLAIVPQIKLANEVALYHHLDNIVKQGGEGLMLHHEKAFYHTGRTDNILKLKPYHDDEAVVIKHIKGKGKFRNSLGAMLVKNTAGITFKIGTGFTDQQRANPPPLGSTITYKYIGKTRRGVPRFASFLRIRNE